MTTDTGLGYVKPLHGLKVVDFTRMLAGPKAGRILADLGADVIKVEGPGQEDPSRLSGEVAGLTFAACNSGKRSVMLDLTNEQGREAARRLALSADIVIQSNRPGAMERWGLGYEQLRKENPRLIYASLSAYGATGPDAARGSVDTIIQAESGIMLNSGVDGGPPVLVGGLIIDETAGLTLLQSIFLALYNRERTGQGTHTEVNLIEVALYLQSEEIAYASVTGKQPLRSGNKIRPVAPAGVVNVLDGAMVIMVLNEPMFERLCTVVGAPEWIEDERFSTRDRRISNHDLLLDLLSQRMASRTRAEWQEALEAQKVLCGPVRDYAEVLEQPQFDAIDSFAETLHGGRTAKFVRWPVRFDGERFPSDVHNPPKAGQNSVDVLREVGYSEEDAAILTGSRDRNQPQAALVPDGAPPGRAAG